VEVDLLVVTLVVMMVLLMMVAMMVLLMVAKYVKMLIMALQMLTAIAVPDIHHSQVGVVDMMMTILIQ
jgi:hypothetical protein